MKWGTQTKLHEASGLSHAVISTALKGSRLGYKAAEKLAQTVGHTPGWWIDSTIEQRVSAIEAWAEQ